MLLDINLLYANAGGNPDESQRLRFASVEAVHEIIVKDEKWRILAGTINDLREKRNAIQKEVTEKMKIMEAADAHVAEINAIGEEIVAAEAEQKALKIGVDCLVGTTGNLVETGVPVSQDVDNNNLILSKWGVPRDPAGMLNHHDLLWRIGGDEPEHDVQIDNFHVHQFKKVEQLIIVKGDPETSNKMQDEMVATTEESYKLMFSPYPVMNLACGARNNPTILTSSHRMRVFFLLFLLLVQSRAFKFNIPHRTHHLTASLRRGVRHTAQRQITFPPPRMTQLKCVDKKIPFGEFAASENALNEMTDGFVTVATNTDVRLQEVGRLRGEMPVMREDIRMLKEAQDLPRNDHVVLRDAMRKLENDQVENRNKIVAMHDTLRKLQEYYAEKRRDMLMGQVTYAMQFSLARGFPRLFDRAWAVSLSTLRSTVQKKGNAEEKNKLEQIEGEFKAAGFTWKQANDALCYLRGGYPIYMHNSPDADVDVAAMETIISDVSIANDLKAFVTRILPLLRKYQVPTNPLLASSYSKGSKQELPVDAGCMESAMLRD